MAQPKTIRALSRGLHVLKALNGSRTATIAELSHRTGLARATVQRSVETLIDEGYVYRVSGSDHFCLASNASTLTSHCDEVERMVEAADGLVTELGREVLWPIDFFVRDEAALVIRASTHHESPMTFLPQTKIGTPIPMIPTAPGRAYLASLEPANCSALLRASRSRSGNARPVAGEDEPSQVLQTVKQLGYGFRRDGLIARTSSIAVAIKVRGQPVACLSMMFFSSAMRIEQAASRYLRSIQRTASAIEASAG